MDTEEESLIMDNNNQNSFYSNNGEQTVQNNGQYSETNSYGQQNPYGQTNQYGQQNPYGQTNQYGQQNSYSQANQYGQQNTYGQSTYYGGNQPPMGDNGKPLKNRFGMKLTFAILEIISCNILTMILGIVACVGTSKANSAFKAGNWEEFKTKAKNSALCLWIGLAAWVLGMIAIFALKDTFMAGFWTGFYGTEAEPTSTDEPQTVVLVDSCPIYLPCEYEDIEEWGFAINSDEIDRTLSAHAIEIFMLENSYGEYIAWAWIENQSEKEAAITDCVIIGINIDEDCEWKEYFMTMDYVDFSYSLSECEDAMGYYDEYAEDGDETTYYWYADNWSDTNWRVTEITFDRYGDICEIDVCYR